MSWRDRLQEAAFRGVPFWVESANTVIGRRSETHVYPLSRSGRGKKNQDRVWTKDLGSVPEKFTLVGYVIQRYENDYDYFDERDELIKAFKTEGPGVLDHPTQAQVLEVSVQGEVGFEESLKDGAGIAKFTVNFVQHYRPVFEQYTKNWTNNVGIKAEDMDNAVLDTMGLGMQALVFASSLQSTIQGAMNQVQGVINGTLGIVSTVKSRITGTLATINATAQSLVSFPGQLAQSLQSGAHQILDLIGVTGDIIEGGVVGPVSGQSRGDTYTLDGTTVPSWLGVSLSDQLAEFANFAYTLFGVVPEEQQNNQKLVTVSMQALMLSVASQVIIRTEFESFQQLESTTNKVTDSMDALLDRLGAFPSAIDVSLIFSSLTNLRATLVESVYGKNTGIAREANYEVPAGIASTLELAYTEYEDLDRAQELFDRNRGSIKHPGFMPSGEAINVLDE